MTRHALLALLVAACAAAPVKSESLVGTRWVGVASADVDPKSLPRLEFVTAERIAGYTGCNMLSGTWRMEGGEARLGPLVTTKRACAGPGGDIEKRVVAALGGKLTRTADRLVFTAPDGARYEFIPAQAS